MIIHRVRQAVITREVSEITGIEALKKDDILAA